MRNEVIWALMATEDAKARVRDAVEAILDAERRLGRRVRLLRETFTDGILAELRALEEESPSPQPAVAMEEAA